MLPKSRELLQAVAKDKISSQAIEELLRSRADINAQTDDKKGDTALIIAAKNGSFQTVQSLLDLKAAVNTRNTQGDTALIHAVLRGHHEIAALLLEKNADTNIKNTIGTTALITAANKGFSHIAKLLLEKGADINLEQTTDSATPLIMAASYNDFQIVELLLKAKADTNKQDSAGDTALMHLLTTSEIEPLDTAAPLTESGASLVTACEKLLAANANIKIENHQGQNALIIATAKGYGPIVDLLLKKDANLDVQEKQQGYTALMLAAGTGHSAIAKLLLQKKAAVNTKSKEGLTALIMAANYSYASIVEMLLEAKADVNSENTDGDTALLLAANPFFLSNETRAPDNYLSICKMLLEANANPNIPNKNGHTALMRSADQGYTAIVELLLGKGAETNFQTKTQGETALIIATGYGYATIVKMLLEAGAGIDIQNHKGGTAFFMACNPYNSTQDTEEVRGERRTIIEMLLTAGASLDILNNEGQTALETAQPFVLDAKVGEYSKAKQITKNIYGLTDDQFKIWRNYAVRDLLFINNYYLYFPDTVCFIICMYLLPADRQEKVITDELQNFVKNSPALHIHRLQTDCATVPRNDRLLEKLLPPKEGFLAKIKNFLTFSTKEASPPKKNTNGKLIKLLLEEFSQFTDDKNIQSSLKTMCENLAKPQFKLSDKEAEDLKIICSFIIENGKGNAFDKTRLKELYKTLSLILSGIQSQDNSTSCTQRRSASPGR